MIRSFGFERVGGNVGNASVEVWPSSNGTRTYIAARSYGKLVHSSVADLRTNASRVIGDDVPIPNNCHVSND